LVGSEMVTRLPGRYRRAWTSSRVESVLHVIYYAMKDDEERVRTGGCGRYIAEPIDSRALPGVVAGYVAKRCGGTSS
jgi:hypothetical protein